MGSKACRNVKDYGAKSAGRTDDTAAIQAAISDGGRCAVCGSSSPSHPPLGPLPPPSPATVYFPDGEYLVSSTILQPANTGLVGNPLSLPHLIAAPNFLRLGRHLIRGLRRGRVSLAPPSPGPSPTASITWS